MRKIITKLLGWKSENTYYDWKKQNRPIIVFLEKYFSEEDLKEFLATGKISKLENVQQSSSELKLHEKAMTDNAIYTAKDKLKRFWGEGWLDTKRFMKKYIKNILSEIKLNNEEYTLDNSKEILIKYTMSDKVNIWHVKNKDFKKNISQFIHENLSEIEAYAILEKSDKIFE